MKVEERGAPGFSKEYINRREKDLLRDLQPHFSHSLAILHTLMAHSRTHTHIGNFVELQRSVMTPISLMCSWMSSDTEVSVSNLACSAGSALPCIRYV